MNIRMKINKYKQINYIYISFWYVERSVDLDLHIHTCVCVCECSNIDKAIYKHLLNGVHFFGAQCPPREAASRHYPKKTHRRTPIYTFFIPNPMSTYIAPLALKVDEKTWGTTWRISSDRVIMHVSPEAPPTIPTWHRISEDGQAVTCLR